MRRVQACSGWKFTVAPLGRVSGCRDDRPARQALNHKNTIQQTIVAFEHFVFIALIVTLMGLVSESGDDTTYHNPFQDHRTHPIPCSLDVKVWAWHILVGKKCIWPAPPPRFRFPSHICLRMYYLNTSKWMEKLLKINFQCCSRGGTRGQLEGSCDSALALSHNVKQLGRWNFVVASALKLVDLTKTPSISENGHLYNIIKRNN